MGQSTYQRSMIRLVTYEGPEEEQNIDDAEGKACLEHVAALCQLVVEGSKTYRQSAVDVDVVAALASPVV